MRCARSWIVIFVPRIDPFTGAGDHVARAQQHLLVHARAQVVVPAPALAADAAHERIEGRHERRHQFIVTRFFRVLEEALHERLVARAIQRPVEIREELRPRPGARVLLPAIREGGEPLAGIDLPQRVDKAAVVRGEALFDEQRGTSIVRRRGRHAAW